MSTKRTPAPVAAPAERRAAAPPPRPKPVQLDFRAARQYIDDHTPRTGPMSSSGIGL